MTAAVSWSGGKDCCLAMHRARAAGLEIRYLLAMFDETGERTRSHAIPREVMQAQADALGLGYRALVVCTDDRWLEPSFCGRAYDRAFIESLPEGVDACGENGEFHTF